jgi:hypothetical protein
MAFSPDEMAKSKFEANDAIDFGTPPTVRMGRSQNFRMLESNRALIDLDPIPAANRCLTLSMKWCWSGKEKGRKDNSSKRAGRVSFFFSS